MNRWAYRIVLLLMLLLFGLVFLQLYKQLVMLQRQQQTQSSAAFLRAGAAHQLTSYHASA